MKIHIKDKDVTLRQTFRAYMAFESIDGKSFTTNGGIREFIILLYCYIVSCDKEIELSYDEYMDFLDEHPDVLTEFINWLVEINKVNEQLADDEGARKEATPKEKTDN